MLSSAHRAGALTSVIGRLRASTALPALLAPMILLSPVAAKAEDQTPSRVFGDKVLTDGADDIANSATVDLTQEVDFGGGEDLLTNTGVITIGAKATGPVQVSLTSLEALINKGTIDMRNGHVGDTLTIAGDYGASKGRLGLDVGPSGADRLVVGDIANGDTVITLGVLSAKTAVLTGDKGPILIQAGVGSKENAFTIENYEIGLIHYGLVYDAATGAYRLKGVAGQRTYEALKISEGASAVWRQSADAWSAHVASLRDAGSTADGAAVWGQAYGGRQDRDDDIKVSSQRTVSADYAQTTYGGQMGVDLINGDLGEEGRILLGVTGGYADARMRFSGVAGQTVKLRVVNFGGYLALTRGDYFLNALAKVDRQSIKARNSVDAIDAKFDGASFGGQIEAGSRTEDGGLAYEKLLSVNYVGTRLDDMETLGQRLDFGDTTGFVAKAGLRGSAQNDLMGGALTTYGAAFVAHDFTVKNSLTLVSGDQSERISNDGGRTFGQLTVGVSYRSGDGVITFLEAGGDYGGGRQGGGLRFGARMGF